MSLRRTAKRLAILGIVLLPAPVFAQASLTGTVRDTSGAILPGVTVEASSEALIEKTRTAVTDESGQYRIIDLRPGTYVLTFTLAGFNTVRRENIELSGTQTATIAVEMRVGALAETITVTGESPVVDVQNVKREMVLQAGVIQAIPATRAVGSLLNVTPGLTVDNNGLAASPTMTFFSARGGQANEGRMTVNGMVVAAAFNGGGVSSYIYDAVNTDEVSIAVSGGLGETDIGGPVMNLVPRAGGNSFRGQAFFNNAGDWSRGSNLDDELREVGIRETPGIIKAYDASVSYGGPIKRDRLWFYGSYRKLDTQTAVEGIVANANTFNAARWDWVADPSITARLALGRTMYIGRLTAQVSEKHRVSFNHEYQLRCEGTPLKVGTDGCRKRGGDWIGLGSVGMTSQSPEATTTAGRGYFDFPYHVTQSLWTSPLTSRMLLEAGYTRFAYYPAFGQIMPDGIFNLIPVTEQSATINPATGLRFAPRANYAYRGLASYGWAYASTNTWRASMSYVTGAHNMKVGYQGAFFVHNVIFYTSESQLAYRFNQGMPNQVTFRLPDWSTDNHTQNGSLFVQDSWTRGRLTLQGAVRYDRVWSSSPAARNGTTRTSAFNAAPISFEKTIGVDAYNDITPRVGVAYDLFGNGKTAVKFNWGHYLDAATNDSIYTSNNPASRTVQTVDRAWTDTNNNRVVDCDLLNPARQTAVDTCAELTGNSLNFGRTGSTLTQVNPDLRRGWGVRENDYQWGINVQQELFPRVSLEVGYNRRWWHGDTVTDNTLRGPEDYDAWTIIAPQDPRLPGGGGYPITLYTVTAAASARGARNLQTFETDFGPERNNYWHGVDLTLNARLRNGLTLQAGTSTGREYENSCATTPNVDSNVATAQVTRDIRNCLDVDPFQTTLRGLATYTVPKVDVLVSATVRSQPPLYRMATGAAWQVPNTVVQSLLGRLPPGAVATGNTTVQLLDDNEHRLYADERRTQIDMRFAKILRFGRTRADIGVDLANLLNTNYATSYENTYQYSEGNVLMGGTWNNPTAVYTPRFVRVNFTLNF